MCAKPYKILSPNKIRVLQSPSTLAVEEKKRNRYRLKLAIRQVVDDMIEMLKSGARKATAFLLAELERLLDYHSWPDAWQARGTGDCQARHSGGALLAWKGGGS